MACVSMFQDCVRASFILACTLILTNMIRNILFCYCNCSRFYEESERIPYMVSVFVCFVNNNRKYLKQCCIKTEVYSPPGLKVQGPPLMGLHHNMAACRRAWSGSVCLSCHTNTPGSSHGGPTPMI